MAAQPVNNNILSTPPVAPLFNVEYTPRLNKYINDNITTSVDQILRVEILESNSDFFTDYGIYFLTPTLYDAIKLSTKTHNGQNYNTGFVDFKKVHMFEAITNYNGTQLQTTFLRDFKLSSLNPQNGNTPDQELEFLINNGVILFDSDLIRRFKSSFNGPVSFEMITRINYSIIYNVPTELKDLQRASIETSLNNFFNYVNINYDTNMRVEEDTLTFKITPTANFPQISPTGNEILSGNEIVVSGVKRNVKPVQTSNINIFFTNGTPEFQIAP